MNKITQKSGIIFLIILSAITFKIIIMWKSSDTNYAFKHDIAKCIGLDKNKMHFSFETEKNYRFEIDLVEHSNPDCINPHFPSIHITTDVYHDAWLHIVYNDSDIEILKNFIDAESTEKQNSIYPFYTMEQDFYDSPIWTYSLFSKPLRFWKGHAFAVHIDYKNKIITCVGGIEWGFELHFTKLTPKAIEPKLINQNAWKKACELLKEKLPDFKFTINLSS